jgi:hypothetical protein
VLSRPALARGFAHLYWIIVGLRIELALLAQSGFVAASVFPTAAIEIPDQRTEAARKVGALRQALGEFLGCYVLLQPGLAKSSENFSERALGMVEIIGKGRVGWLFEPFADVRWYRVVRITCLLCKFAISAIRRPVENCIYCLSRTPSPLDTHAILRVCSP